MIWFIVDSLNSSAQEAALPTQRIGRKYKNQLRDFLSNCRTKRKSGGTPEYLAETPSWTPVAAAATAAAAAYSPSVYPTTPAAPYTAAADTNSFYMHHQQNLQTLPMQPFYPALDNRFMGTENLFHGYRGLGVGVGVGSCASYYAAEYSPYVHAAAATTNGFLTAGYDSSMGNLPHL